MEILKPLDTLKTRRECALKLLEEASEACEALKTHDKRQEYVTYMDALFELVDVLQCVTNYLAVLNPSSEEFDDTVMCVRNNNMTRGRNELDDGLLRVKWDDAEKVLSVDWGCRHHELKLGSDDA